jgi:hypothetical protein
MSSYEYEIDLIFRLDLSNLSKSGYAQFSIP